MSAIIPTEDQEQMALVQWLDMKKLPYFHPPQETFTKSWKQKARNKAMGVKSGVPDLFIVVPAVAKQNFDETANMDHFVMKSEAGYCYKNRLIAIELKRTKGGVVSASQCAWLKTLNEAGVESFVAKGCDEAIKIIEGILRR